MMTIDDPAYSDRHRGHHHRSPSPSRQSGRGTRDGHVDQHLDDNIAAGAVSSSLTSSVLLPLRWQGLSAAAGAGDVYVEDDPTSADLCPSSVSDERLGSVNHGLIHRGEVDQIDYSPD